MFSKSVDERLSEWSSLRKSLTTSPHPLSDVCEFWSHAPFIPYNRSIDHYNQQSWCSPWEIIEENKYDDFTKALMMAWTLKLSKPFATSSIELHSYTDASRSLSYTVVVVDRQWVLNFNDNEAVPFTDLPDTLLLENSIELRDPS